MSVYQCKRCGGELSRKEDGLFICVYCGTVQTIDYAEAAGITDAALSAAAIEHVYESAIQSMALGKYDTAICLLTNISGYRDADERVIACQRHIEENDLAAIYENACTMAASAASSDSCKAAADLFKQIIGYKDAAARMTECLGKAEGFRNEELYARAVQMMGKRSIHFMQNAADIFSSIPQYRDSCDKYRECLRFIENQQKEIEQKNVELRRTREQAKRKKRIIIVGLILAVIIIALLCDTVGK